MRIVKAFIIAAVLGWSGTAISGEPATDNPPIRWVPGVDPRPPNVFDKFVADLMYDIFGPQPQPLPPPRVHRQARQKILEGHDPLNNCEAEGIWYQCQIPREM